MKKLVTFCFLLSFVLLQSCSDPCEDISCNNNGVCDDGTCLCEDGYSGVSCDDVNRTVFIGDWGGEYECPASGSISADISITEGTEGIDAIEILIEGTQRSAKVTSPNSFVLVEQTEEIEFQGNIIFVTVNGSGVLNTNNSLDIEIVSAFDNGGNTVCTFSGSK